VAKYFEGNYQVILENNGRNLRMTYICCETPYVYGGAQPNAEQKYFWFWSTVYVGEDSKSGSAHTIDGKSYPMELVIQFLNLRDEASPVDQQNSVSVSMLFEETPEDNPDLHWFIDHVKNVQDYNKVDSFNQTDLLKTFIPTAYQTTPGERLKYFNQFYHYQGSLLSPPCDDGVYWYIMRLPSKIGKNQLAELRKAKDENGELLAGNRRPQQSLGGRSVVASDVRVISKLG